MDTTFWIKLSLSFFVGGIWISAVTIAAERLGSRIGGVIGGFPSTALLTLLFIGITQSPDAASEATTIMPVSQGFNGIFIIVYLLLADRGLAPAIGSAVLVWFTLVSFLLVSGFYNFGISLLGWAILIISCYLFVDKCLQINVHGKIEIHYTPRQVLMRALFGGSVIAFAVFLGKFGGPKFGGVFATFPAIFFSTLVITHITGGPDFSRAVAKVLMVSGVLNVALYATAVRFFYPWCGLVLGTLCAVILSAAITYLIFLFLREKMS